LRSLLKSQDNWKVTFREQHEMTYTTLWRSLIRSEKFDEALFVAEQGRAQALSDNLLIHYKLPMSLSADLTDTKETISRLFTELSTPTIFLATEGLTVYIWFLRRENKVAFRRGRLEGDRRERDPIHALLQSSLEKIRAEYSVRSDRTFELSMEARGEGPRKLPLLHLDNPFKPFYDAVIDPIVDMLEPQDDELLIIPNGALGLTPWAAVIESMRIRTVPSLTSYQLILCPRRLSQENRGAFGRKSELKKIEKTLTLCSRGRRLTLCSRRSRNDCIIFQHQTPNRETGNKS